jgi:hypothetical protein
MSVPKHKAGDGGSMFLQNVSVQPQDYTMQKARGPTSELRAEFKGEGATGASTKSKFFYGKKRPGNHHRKLIT